jgi:hypothetical protein
MKSTGRPHCSYAALDELNIGHGLETIVAIAATPPVSQGKAVPSVLEPFWWTEDS